MLPDKFVVIDLETTGLDPERHRIIEIAVLKVEGGEVKDLYQTLVNPGVPLPFYIQKLTGIDEKMLSLAKCYPSPRIWIGFCPFSGI
ncbi:MAG TPA: hypothetical protein ENM97_07360 [Moorella mulderi]|nr:hypothetical protein [Moorella mulderi]